MSLKYTPHETLSKEYFHNALALWYGEDVPKDRAKAISLMHKADCLQNYLASIFSKAMRCNVFYVAMLGDLYRYGTACGQIVPDYQKAYEWYEAAVKGGHYNPAARSIYQLYYDGLLKDDESCRALFWLHVAAMSGDVTCGGVLEELISNLRMSHGEAEEEVEEYRTMHVGIENEARAFVDEYLNVKKP